QEFGRVIVEALPRPIEVGAADIHVLFAEPVLLSWGKDQVALPQAERVDPGFHIGHCILVDREQAHAALRLRRTKLPLPDITPRISTAVLPPAWKAVKVTSAVILARSYRAQRCRRAQTLRRESLRRLRRGSCGLRRRDQPRPSGPLSVLRSQESAGLGTIRARRLSFRNEG